MDIRWLQELEPPVRSISFVLLEQKKNCWYNNYSKDWHIKFEGIGIAKDRPSHMPLGQIGNVVQEIIECEVNYVCQLFNFFRIHGL